jgi:hypothetical protein
VIENEKVVGGQGLGKPLTCYCVLSYRYDKPLPCPIRFLVRSQHTTAMIAGVLRHRSHEKVLTARDAEIEEQGAAKHINHVAVPTIDSVSFSARTQIPLSSPTA